MRPATSHGPRCTLFTRLALILALLALGLTGPATPPARATTLLVTGVAPAGPGSLRQAILDAEPGDTITFDASLSGATIFAGSALVLDKDLTIDGSALAEPVALSGLGAARILEVASDVTVILQGLVITQGAAGDHNPEVDTEDDHGGGIYNLGTLTLSDCTFSANSAERFGGAIYSTGVLTVTRCTFAANSAAMAAGGIVSRGALTVIDSTFTDNTSGEAEVGGEAGAIASLGPLTVSGSTFSGNSAMMGGAIACDSPALVTNSTFYGNTAALGGGIAANTSCALTLSHCTFSGNAADYHEMFGKLGGAIVTFGVLTYTHTIMVDSVNGDCRLIGDATVAVSSRNLVEDGSCGAELSGDPRLGPLADYGGPTHTMALLSGSPALNAGDAADCAATDQRGVARPQGVGCDLGAYEQELPSASTEVASDVTPTGATLQGTVNARHSPTTVTFAYGLDTGYGLTATVPSGVTGAADTAVSAALTGLAPATTYHYRVVALNAAGTVFGVDATFTTLPPPRSDLYLPAIRR